MILQLKNDLYPREIAYCHDIPEDAKSSILWLSGYASVMDSVKANAIAGWTNDHHIEMMRFDYSGLGKSSGEFARGNLSIWLEEASEIYQKMQNRPSVIVGSSMGAWLALLLTQYIHKNNLPPQKALLLLAPAIDFTHELLLKKITEQQLSHFQKTQLLEIPSLYDPKPLKIHYQFIQDAKRHLLLNNERNFQISITIIHGAKDKDIPIELAYKAQKRFNIVNFLTIEDGEHRLSRDADIELILKTIERIIS